MAATRRPSGPLARGGASLTRGDPYWPAQLAVLAALLLYLTLPEKLTIGPRWLVPALEGALLVGLATTTPVATATSPACAGRPPSPSWRSSTRRTCSR